MGHPLVVFAAARRLEIAPEIMRARNTFSLLALVGGLQAEIDSAGGRPSIGSMTNPASFGSAVATENFSVGTTTNHAGLAEARHPKLIPVAEANLGHSYCSWKKGLNLRSNRLIHQYFPKVTDFTKFTQACASCFNTLSLKTYKSTIKI